MNYKRRHNFVPFVLLLTVFSGFFIHCNSEKLLILMIDAFRWDYYENLKEKLPGLTQFIAEGVQAEWVEPIFPSETFPSVTTIATGLFPENHGIIGNFINFMNRSDTTAEKYFDRRAYSTNTKWLQAEPIWVTAVKENLKTSVSRWPLSNTFYDGIVPDNLVVHVKEVPLQSSGFEMDLDKSLKLLAEDYSLAMLYYPEIDRSGHPFGPDSPQTREAIIDFDMALLNFIDKLNKSPISDQLNVIIVSDHGMTKIGDEAGVLNVKLSDYVNLEYVDKIFNEKTLLMITAAYNCLDKLHHQLTTMPGVDVYKREEIPEDFHFKNSDAVLDFLVVARTGYNIQGVSGGKQIPANGTPCTCKGNHGYYNMTDMRAAFFAKGPAFKRGYVHSPIRLEDEYQIFAKILGIPALPNNGSWTRVASMLLKN